MRNAASVGSGAATFWARANAAEADVFLTVNNETGVATILVAGQFAQPTLCEKR